MTAVDTDRILELADDSPEGMYELFEERGLGRRPAPRAADARAGRRHARARRRATPTRCSCTLLPRAGIVTRRVWRSTRCSRGARPRRSRWCSPRSRALAHARGQPPRRQRHHPPRSRRWSSCRRGRRRLRVQRRGRRVRPRQPRQRDRRARGPADDAARRRRAARDRATQRRHGQPAKYTYCVGREPRRLAVGVLPGELGASTRPARSPCTAARDPQRARCRGRRRYADLILDKIASAMTSLGMNNAPSARPSSSSLLGPEHAQRSSPAPGTRSRRCRPAYLFEPPACPAGVFRRHFEELAWDEWMKTCRPRRPPADDRRTPSNIRVFVVGGPGKHSSCPVVGDDQSVTLPVERLRPQEEP